MVGIEETLKLMGTPRLDGRNLEVDVTRIDRAQRAEQNIDRMKDIKKKIRDRISKKYKIDAFMTTEEVLERELYSGNLKLADVKGELRYKKTPYKAVSEGMEAHMQGIAFHFGRGRWLTDVVRRDGNPYVHTGKLLDDLEIILAGHLNVAIECNVNPVIKWTEPKETLIIPYGVDKEISANSIRLLAQIGYALPLEEDYLKAYRKEAAKGAPKNGVNVTEVSPRRVVEAGAVEKETVDWTNVVRSLISAPMENHDRKWDPELPYLVDKTKWFGPRWSEVKSFYELSEGKNGERPGPYVSVRSFHERIQMLKEEGAGKAKEHYAELKPVF